MLIEKDMKDKSKSRYACDRCKKILSNENKIGIYESFYKETLKKKFDFCPKCYTAMIRAVNKGIQR